MLSAVSFEFYAMSNVHSIFKFL